MSHPNFSFGRVSGCRLFVPDSEYHQAAKFKKTTGDVKAPQRVEQVIAKVKALSEELGAQPAVTEKVYRAMIAAFIEAELAKHAALAGAPGQW